MWSFKKHTLSPGEHRSREMRIALITRTICDLARARTGALVVLQGSGMLSGHLDGGIVLDGTLSEQLLKSIFDPHSAGHDGAVIIEGDRVSRFAVHLPLSKNLDRLQQGGTRHAAGLGISEVTDSLCLVVSEERGTISVAYHGELHPIADAHELSTHIEHFYEETHAPAQKKSSWDMLRRNRREKIAALALAFLIWFVHVYGSKIEYKTLSVPVQHAELESNLTIASIEPSEVEVTFSGPRRALYFLNKEKVSLFLKTLKLPEGTHSLRISGANFTFPKDVHLEGVDPSSITITIKKSGGRPDEVSSRASVRRTPFM
jgi:diadenylate cyclase